MAQFDIMHIRAISSPSHRIVYHAGGDSKLQNQLRTVPVELSWLQCTARSFHSADILYSTGGAVGADMAYMMYARGATVICRRPLAAAAGSDYRQVGVTSFQSTQSETDDWSSAGAVYPSGYPAVN